VKRITYKERKKERKRRRRRGGSKAMEKGEER